MIYNEIEALHQLAEKPDSYFKCALEFLEKVQKEGIADGRYEILGDKVYANVESYETRVFANTRYEAHKNYIDIQYMISGAEEIGVADENVLDVEEDYDPDRDIAFYKESSAGKRYSITDGQFLVFFPEDAHRPCIAVNETPAKVQKMVIKIAVGAVAKSY